MSIVSLNDVLQTDKLDSEMSRKTKLRFYEPRRSGTRCTLVQVYKYVDQFQVYRPAAAIGRSVDVASTRKTQVTRVYTVYKPYIIYIMHIDSIFRACTAIIIQSRASLSPQRPQPAEPTKHEQINCRGYFLPSYVN